MRILVAPYAGFCFGVRRAMEMARAVLQKRGTVACLGPLIHNRQAVAALEAEGLRTVASLQQVPPGTPVMVRTHGAGPEVYEQIRAGGWELVDATCPFVRRAQGAARQFHQQGYQVLVLGDRNHPEARGLVQCTGGAAVVVEKAQEAAQLTLRPRVAIVCQTTQQLASLTELVAALLPRVSELRIANTICDATTQRQQASAALARQVQAMVVVGGYDSANTKRLAQICQATGTPTYHVETAEEIQEEWFGGLDAVGLTAGASTPDEVIEAVVTRLMDIGGPQAQVEWLGRPSASQSRGGDQNGHHQL